MPFEIDLGGGMSFGTDGHLRTDIGGMSFGTDGHVHTNITPNLRYDLTDGSVDTRIGNFVIDGAPIIDNSTNDRPTVDRIETRTPVPAARDDEPDKPKTGFFASIKNAFKKLFG